MNEKKFIDKYFEQYRKNIFEHPVHDLMVKMKNILVKANKSGHRAYFVGNGASAAIASHCALDYTKQAGICSQCFNESSLLTAYSNDYGYPLWVTKALQFYSKKGDICVFISSSGKSPNIVNAAKYARKSKLKVITFTGFSRSNPLKELGDINFWVNSKSYNLIECTHMFWLMTVCDLIIKKMEYAVS